MELRCSLCVVAAIAAVAALSGVALPAMAWTGEATLDGPSEIKAGDNITVGVSFESSTRTEVKISNVSLRFDWMPYGTYLYSKVVPVNVGPNGTYVFYFSVSIPDNAEPRAHQAEARVFASDPKEPSGWEIAYSEVYHLTLTIADESEGSSVCSLVVLAAPALVAAPFAGTLLTRRRNNSS